MVNVRDNLDTVDKAVIDYYAVNEIVIDFRFESSDDLINLYSKVKTCRNKFGNINISLFIWYMPHFIKCKYNYRHNSSYSMKTISDDFVISFINELQFKCVYIFDLDRDVVLGKLNNAMELEYGDVATILDNYDYIYNSYSQIVAENHHTLDRYGIKNGETVNEFLSKGNELNKITYIATYSEEISMDSLRKLKEHCDKINVVVTHYGENLRQEKWEIIDHIYTSNSNINFAESTDRLSIFKANPLDLTNKALIKQEWEETINQSVNKQQEWETILSNEIDLEERYRCNDNDSVEINQLKGELLQAKLEANMNKELLRMMDNGELPER